MIQQVSYRPIKCQSRSWPSRVTAISGSHKGESTYLNQQGFNTRQYLCWAQQPMENRKLIGVKIMSLFVYRIQLLLSGVLLVFQNRNHNLQKYCVMCCPTNKVIKYCTELLAVKAPVIYQIFHYSIVHLSRLCSEDALWRSRLEAFRYSIARLSHRPPREAPWRECLYTTKLTA